MGPNKTIKVITIGDSSVKITGDIIITENTTVGCNIKGNIVVEGQDVKVHISGKVEGNITNASGLVYLAYNSEVKGDIICKTITIENGAILSGSVLADHGKESTEVSGDLDY